MSKNQSLLLDEKFHDVSPTSKKPYSRPILLLLEARRGNIDAGVQLFNEIKGLTPMAIHSCEEWVQSSLKGPYLDEVISIAYADFFQRCDPQMGGPISFYLRCFQNAAKSHYFEFYQRPMMIDGNPVYMTSLDAKIEDDEGNQMAFIDTVSGGRGNEPAYQREVDEAAEKLIESLPSFSEREKEILGMLIQGMNVSEISFLQGISYYEADAIVKKVTKKVKRIVEN